MKDTNPQPLADGQSAKRIITIGDKTGTLFINGNPTGIQVTVYNEDGLTRAQLLALLNPVPATLETRELTEAEVITFFKQKVAEYAPQFPELRDLRIENCSHGFYITSFLGESYESVSAIDSTIEKTARKLRLQIPDPAVKAAKLRADAAKLLAQADKLTPSEAAA